MTKRIMTSGLHERLERTRMRVHEACVRSGRTRSDVTLIAVSKTWPAHVLDVLYALDVRDFGENYVQDWQSKAKSLPEDIRWHFIGHLQSNKVKMIADRMHMVHTLDRVSVAQALERRSKHPVDVLLQVNLARESSKFGVQDGDAILRLLDELLSFERVRPRGLMAIPPAVHDAQEARVYFAHMRMMLERCCAHVGHAHTFDVLSMGMSQDFEVAIEEGATHVRVGSSIFGPRGIGT